MTPSPSGGCWPRSVWDGYGSKKRDKGFNLGPFEESEGRFEIGRRLSVRRQRCRRRQSEDDEGQYEEEALRLAEAIVMEVS